MNLFDYFFAETASLDKDLVLGSKETVSYQKMHADSLKLASYLQQKYGEDQKIIVIIPNSVYFITVYLAIFKSGNVCVPLNPTIEANNLKYIIDTCKSTLCFTTKRLRQNYKENINLYVSVENFKENLTLFLESNTDSRTIFITDKRTKINMNLINGRNILIAKLFEGKTELDTQELILEVLEGKIVKYSPNFFTNKKNEITESRLVENSSIINKDLLTANAVRDVYSSSSENSKALIPILFVLVLMIGIYLLIKKEEK